MTEITAFGSELKVATASLHTHPFGLAMTTLSGGFVFHGHRILIIIK